MPHQCTNCQTIYENGDSEILEGCSCGSNKFQYVEKVSDLEQTDSQEVTNTAQDEARRSVATEEEIENAKPYAGDEPTDADEITDADVPNQEVKVKRDPDTLKDELNSQFEGIRILEQGKYQINLMQLYKNNTQVISIQEDGKYIINVSETYESA